MPEELWTEVCDTVQETVIKILPKKKAKLLFEVAIKIAEKRKEAKGKEGKGKIHPAECRLPENSKEREESILK